MTTWRPADLWVADVPFTDGSASKKRPVLVLWLDGRDAIVAAVTSASPRGATDVVLTDWQAAGLRVPSTVRLGRLDCFEQNLLVYRLGRIAPDDASHLKHVWASHVQPQF